MSTMNTGVLRTSLTLTWLGLMMSSFGSCHRRGHGYPSQNFVDITVTLQNGQELSLPFTEIGFQRMLSDCLCNERVGSCYYYSRSSPWYRRYSELIPGDQVATWQIQVGYHYPYNDVNKTPVLHELRMKWHSYDSPVKCLEASCSSVLDQRATCQTGLERVYLGANRWLEINEYARVCDQCSHNGNDCEDGQCTSMFSNNSVALGDIADIMGNNTASAQTESSSIETPVIVGIIIAILIVLILLVIFCVILCRCRKSKQAVEANKETKPTFAVFNPGAYDGAEVVYGENAWNEATENGDTQSVSTLGLPPPYDEVVSAQNANTQHGFTNNTYAV